MKCKKGFEVVVCQSAAGFYLGTKDEMGMPNCRLSDYAETADAVKDFPLRREHNCIENEYCNGGTGCFV